LKNKLRGEEKVVKVKAIIILTMALFLTTSCIMVQENTPLEDVIPWGTWVRDDLEMVLYLEPEFSLPVLSTFTYPGRYLLDYEWRKTFISFNTLGGMIGSYRPHFVQIYDVAFLWGNDYYYRSGNDGFSIIEGQLHISIWNCETMIFNRVEDLIPINPEYWLVTSEYLPGVWQSENPNIILYLDPYHQYSVFYGSEGRVFLNPIPRYTAYGLTPTFAYPYFGILNYDGEEIRLIAEMSRNGRTFQMSVVGAETWTGYIGILSIQGEQLHLDLGPSTRRETGLSEIIFNRAIDYEPLVPDDDWFPHLN